LPVLTVSLYVAVSLSF